MGVPITAVKLKMRQDGVTQKDTAAFLKAHFEDDPAYARFFKMLKLGVPLKAIELKMRAEGLDPIVIGCEESDSIDDNVSSMKKGRNKKKKNRVKHKRVFWKEAAQEVKEGTLWHHQGDDENDVIAGLDIDVVDIKGLFMDTTKKKKGKGRKKGSVKDKRNTEKLKAGSVHLLPRKRSTNVCICLARLRLDVPKMCEAIRCLDLCSVALEPEQIIMLHDILPEPNEIKRVTQFLQEGKGRTPDLLCDAEKFFLDISKVERLNQRMAFFVYASQFPIKIDVVSTACNEIKVACDEVIESRSLRLILKVVLHLGNKVNNLGGNGSSARAITIESLSQFGRTKSFKGSVSLLDVLENILAQQAPQSLLILTELPSLEAASRQTGFSTLKNQLRQLTQGLQTHQREVSLVAGKGIDVSNAEAFLRNAGGKLVQLANNMKETENGILRFINYFSEDKSYQDNPAELFDGLYSFLASLKKSHILNAENRARKARTKMRSAINAAKKMKEKLKRKAEKKTQCL
eukprot:g5094.t1